MKRGLCRRLVVGIAAAWYFRCTAAWYIAPPTLPKDWTNLSRLVVDTFDAPRGDASALDKARWFLFENELSKRATYSQYVGTARKMKGAKYSVLLAKEAEEVIGVAEIGISFDAKDKDRRPTIGLICVSKAYRQQGVGAALVERCERLVADVWNGTTLYAEVEERNERAVEFFQSLGYCAEDDRRVMVTLRHGLQFEQVPHLLLSQKLKRDKVTGHHGDETNWDVATTKD
jgi:ribosomal protein S18 acetylase RimI-like enzyme